MESKMLWSGYSFDAGLVGPLVPPLATEVLGGCVAVSGGVADGTAVLAADGTAVLAAGLSSYGLISYGLSSYGLISYDLSSYGLCSYGLSSYDLCSYGGGM